MQCYCIDRKQLIYLSIERSRDYALVSGRKRGPVWSTPPSPARVRLPAAEMAASLLTTPRVTLQADRELVRT